MSSNTKIEWTQGDDGTPGATWNPVTGCEKVSPGCDHCYAETFAERWRGVPGHHFENGFDVTLRPERLDQPLRWRKPRRIFVNSMSDLFHEAVPDEFIACTFVVMALARQHTFQVLTKRHGRMRSLLSSPDFQVMCFAAAASRGWEVPESTPWPLPNVWLGVSVEDQKWADIRIPALWETPAAVRFLSCEPLLGAIDIERWLWDGDRDMPGRIHWVIAGGESGPKARPMHPDWARSLRDQCVAADVPFFFKQWGAHAPWAPDDYSEPKDAKVVYPDGRIGWVAGDEYRLTNWSRGLPEGWAFATRVGKKAAGRELDGREWSEFPVAAKAAAA